MDDKIKRKVQELLTSGRIKGFLGLRELHGHVGPYLFTDANDLEGLVVGDRKTPGDTRYPLNKHLIMIARGYPEESFGVLIRGCDERGLKTLISSNQLNAAKVVSVGLACPQELADACECLKPFPDEFVAGESGEARPYASVERVESIELDERFESWLGEFAKCMKCYGCRNICPMCYCPECTLEGPSLLNIGNLPPESPIFHLTRALHMAGRCIDCGLCTEACPADIPLRTLYKKVADIIEQEFHFRPGYDDSKTKPSIDILGEAAKH
ncbi:MAG: 4Fe-4S binding protein [Syntrophobacteraceae bacterium]